MTTVTWSMRRPTPIRQRCRSLYVIEIGTDRIKVGIGEDPVARLSTHRSIARAYGTTTGREWISPRRADADTERELIRFCAERATQRFCREYFADVRFEDAVQRAAELTHHTAQHVQRRIGGLVEWSIKAIAEVLLATTPAAVHGLVASGALTPVDPAQDQPIFTRDAIDDWLASQPDLLGLPRAVAA